MRSSSLRRWAVLAVLTLVVIASATVAVIWRWPAISARLAHWTGEEEPRAQLKGLVELAQIWLMIRPLQLDTDRPLPHTGTPPYAVSVFLEQEADETAVARSLDMIKAAGIQVIRQQFPWQDIEVHAKGDFEDRRNEPPRSAWAKYDRIVDLAQARGLTIIARLDAPPTWSRANHDADNTFGPPDNYDDYGDFVTAVVTRYKGRLRYLQIWNEPNIYPEWGVNSPDPEAYTELLALAWRRARAVDPSIAIISAPLAPTLHTTAQAMYDLDYLQRMLDAGAAQYFDILGIIAYGLGTGPDDARVVWHRTNFGRPLLIRDLMVHHGAGDKPHWLLEMGWNATPEGMPAPFGRVSDEQQARYTLDAYHRIEREYPWIGIGCLWFFRRPNGEWFQRPEGYFRLVNPDWTTMPVYDALAAEATAPPHLRRGFHTIHHPALHLSGPWQANTGSGDGPGSVQGGIGATLSFTFDGSGAFVSLAPETTDGAIEVSVDGAGRRRYALNRSSREVALVNDLNIGRHDLTATVVTGVAAIDGVRIALSGDGSLRRGLLIVTALAAILGASGALWPGVHRTRNVAHVG